MDIHKLKPRKVLNKAFLKVKPNRQEIEHFKANLMQLLDRTNEHESEEFHKNLVIDFLKKTYYEPNHFVNTKGRNDLVIHNGPTAKTPVGVILEAKKPTNKTEMVRPTADGDTPAQKLAKLNTKAFQELILYYLRERIKHKNLEVKHLVITNIYEWFIFDATTFDRVFAQHKGLVKQFQDFEEGRLADTRTDFFYKQIAEPFIAGIETNIEYTYFNLPDYERPLRNMDKQDDNKLIALFKLLSPEHLLKLPFANDSNSLDKRFYSELLHIIGLTETKDGSKKLIGRNKPGERNSGSILENAIIQLDSMDKLSRLDRPSQYGSTQEERLFSVALELSITWVNRILFLKLLEAQLITYHKGDQSYSFLDLKKIKNYDDLNGLFFQVLARRHEDRNPDVKAIFEKVPYLNSSLFEPTDMEHNTLFISNLKDEKPLPIYSQTVLKDKQGKKQIGELSTLEYLFEFLNAYDFSSEGSEEIQEDNKTLINASVLGLIFEKINGYKDGSFFTPGFITMYMCRETIRKAVVQKFTEYNRENKLSSRPITAIDDIYELIPHQISRKQANEIINNIKICDPAVGSGHFLVSALNEMIAVKNDLKILEDREGKSIHRYEVEVVNDELITTDEEGELFEYNPNNRESQRVQETLFHEKQTIIENCLFGVDINPNSVKICRLRLWIELLKNAYYINSSPTPSSSPAIGRWQKAGGVLPLNNLPHLKTFRKNLRNNLTPAEAKLWSILKGRGLDDRKFRRQHSVANYILDFYCPEERLAIELDGQGHFEFTQMEKDRERDLFLAAFGIKVLRFENRLVWEDLEGVLGAVRDGFGWERRQEPPRPSDTPPLEGGELLSGFGSPSQTHSGEVYRELQTLPNIDINIKCGNSLVSRFAIDADLKQALKKSKWTISSYRLAVATYRNAESKEQKREMQRLIGDIKSDFRSEINKNDPKLLKVSRLNGELFNLMNQQELFEVGKREKATRDKRIATITKEVEKLEGEIETIKSNKIFENAFEWRFEFPEVLNEEGDFVGFDVVIGNPPYFSMSKIKEQGDYFSKAGFETYSKGSDIYCLFYEVGGNILRKDGFLTYITSNSWLRAIYGELLKKYFVKYMQPVCLLNIEDIQIFEEATVESNIIILQKRKLSNSFPVVNLADDYNLGKSLSDYFAANHFDFLVPETAEWFIGNLKEGNLKLKIESCGKPLKEFEVKINFGIKTGFNEAFIIDTFKKDELISLDSNNKEIIKPILRGRDVQKNSLVDPKLFVIGTFPSLKIDIEAFPTIKEYMSQFLPKLNQTGETFTNSEGKTEKSRKKTSGEWFETQDSITYWKEFEKPKIVWGEISDKPKFAYDDKGYYAEATTFLMTGEKLKFLLAILNSKVSEWYFNLIGTTTGMGTNRWKKYKIEQLPIKEGTEAQQQEIASLVDEILLTKGQDPSGDTSLLESQIDQLVYELYGLTQEEIEIVERSVR